MAGAARQTMRLVSVNVSAPRVVSYQGRRIRTGIFKEPVTGPVAVRALGLEGDGQADRRVHGGRHQALYAYPAQHYDYWRAQLARNDLTPGHLGENLTLQGVSEATVCIGDVFRIGDTVLQVSQPRTPCFKLALRMETPDFPELFLASGRVGFYLRVLEEGTVEAGDDVERLAADPGALSVRRLVRLRTFERADRRGLQEALGVAALSPRWRRSLEKLYAETLNGGPAPEPRFSRLGEGSTS